MIARTVLALVFTVYALPAFAVPIVSVAPSPTNVNVNDTFSLSVKVGETDPGAADDVADMFAYQFSVSYNHLVLSVLGITEGAFLQSGGGTTFVPGTDDGAGLISFTIAALNGVVPGVIGSGTLFDIQFKAIAAGVSTVSAFFDPVNFDGLYDSNLALIATGTPVDATVNVAAVPQMPEPALLLLLSAGLIAARVRVQRGGRTR